MKAADFRQQQARALPEKDFGLQVEEIARTLGVRYYHTHNSRHSAPGFPDYVFAGTRILWRELKTETGKVTLAQQGWMEALQLADQNAAVWRPADLLSGRILDELRAISPRSTRH